MYRDITGKTGIRQLKGTSGKTYGNLLLLEAEELADALADGITEVVSTAPVGITDEEKEVRRVAAIKGTCRSKIIELWDEDDQRNALARSSELLEILTDGGALTTEQIAERDVLKAKRQYNEDMRAFSKAKILDNSTTLDLEYIDENNELVSLWPVPPE